MNGKCRASSAEGRKIAPNVYEIDCKYEILLLKVDEGGILGLHVSQDHIHGNACPTKIAGVAGTSPSTVEALCCHDERIPSHNSEGPS